MDCILVADAEAQTVAIVVEAAARAELSVVIVADGVQALERYRSLHPRILVVDGLLPVLDGIRVVQKIRETFAGDTAAILLTGALLDPATLECDPRLRLSAIIEKPLSRGRLLETLAPFLRQPAAGALPGASRPLGDGAASVETTPVSRMLAEVVAGHRFGELVWSDGAVAKSLFVTDGEIVATSSNSPDDTWSGWIRRDPCLLPETRMELAALAEEEADADLVQASIGRRTLSIALELVAVDSGRVEFVDGALPPAAQGLVDGQKLVLYGLRHCPGRSFDDALPSGTQLLRRTSQRADWHRLELTPFEQQVLALADGRHTMSDLLSVSRAAQTDIRPFLYGALRLGLLAPSPQPDSPAAVLPGAPAAVTGSPPTGSLAERHAASLLAGLCAAGRSGVFHVRDGSRQAAVHLSQGRIVFARSNLERLRLGEVLLTTAKITPLDHGKALAIQTGQPRRRIGSILLALGALSLSELYDGLVSQVRSILADIFTWTDGQYSFLDGPLPTDDVVQVADRSTIELLLQLTRDPALDAVVERYLPADTATLICRSDLERTKQLLDPTPAELVVLDAASRGARVGELKTGAAADPGLLRALFGLLSLGCLTSLVSNDPATLPMSQAASPAPTHSGGVIQEEPDGDYQELLRANAELRRQVAALQAEIERLQGQFSEDPTVLTLARQS